MAGIEGFVCEPLGGARLTAASCGRRFEAMKPAKGADGKRRQGDPSLKALACSGCVIGKAHLAGKQPLLWPDGKRIVRLTLVASGNAVGPDAPPPAITGRDDAAMKRSQQRMHRKRNAGKPIEPAPRPATAPEPVAPVETAAPAPAPAPAPEKRRPGRPRKIRPELPVPPPAPRVPPVGNQEERRRRSGRVLEAGGYSDTIMGHARRIGVSHNVISERLRRGWPVEDACTLPKGSMIVTRTGPGPIRALRKIRSTDGPREVLEAYGFSVVHVSDEIGGWSTFRVRRET